jgi:Tol biopolymer transport system component
MIAEPSGIPIGNVSGSTRWIYPTWSSDGTQLVVMNVTGENHPHTSLVSLNGTVAQANLNGNDANGRPMYGGFASPRPGNPSLIAYAGQPNAPGWNGASPAGYDQDRNYVFLNATSGTAFISAPLEPDANITRFDKARQGRAPCWSPDGRYLAFESNRVDGGHYAIFLVNVSAGSNPVQVTDVIHDAQHAKFFPDGKSLIVTAFQTAGHGSRGIAQLDISGFL